MAMGTTALHRRSGILQEHRIEDGTIGDEGRLVEGGGRRPPLMMTPPPWEGEARSHAEFDGGDDETLK